MGVEGSWGANLPRRRGGSAVGSRSARGRLPGREFREEGEAFDGGGSPEGRVYWREVGSCPPRTCGLLSECGIAYFSSTQSGLGLSRDFFSGAAGLR